ncbi:hypothetical protein P7K49_002160 [Saguinus oedipus]|uniref:Uncharacterized protein n=1 Tax=Saguinus oedipus TaxID=9490 RepID=A0ABQ9WIJ0_SAGOE|nr:hypothetical protein P7K49_002160 [Saguinus oedipus]
MATFWPCPDPPGAPHTSAHSKAPPPHLTSPCCRLDKPWVPFFRRHHCLGPPGTPSPEGPQVQQNGLPFPGPAFEWDTAQGHGLGRLGVAQQGRALMQLRVAPRWEDEPVRWSRDPDPPGALGFLVQCPGGTSGQRPRGARYWGAQPTARRPSPWGLRAPGPRGAWREQRGPVTPPT